MRCMDIARLEAGAQDDKRSSGGSTSAGDAFPMPGDPILPPSYPAKPAHPAEDGPDAEFDYEGAVRASYYGRRIYPSFDPAVPRSCPVRFIRQFEHAAQHNGLRMKAWAKRLDSCLHGRAEDWAFDECPLEMAGTSWDARKQQFLDWALLPAEQELRRQRLLRFYQAESDLSIDFVYTFEEAALGLRDYKEDVWVRKCIANLLPPIRSGLFEFWAEGLPARFRDLRDSLYAVDWSLYEAASTPFRVVKCRASFAYEACAGAPGQPPASSAAACPPAERQPASRPSATLTGSATNLPHAHMYSPPAASPSILPTRRRRAAAGTIPGPQPRAHPASPPAAATSGSSAGSSSDGRSHRGSSELGRGLSTGPGIGELVSTLSRIPGRDRALIVAALEKLAGADEDPAQSTPSGSVSAAAAAAAVASPRLAKSRGRLPVAPSPTSVPLSVSGGTKSRAATAAAVAAAAHQLASMDVATHQLTSMDATTRPPFSPGARNAEYYASSPADTSQGASGRTSAGSRTSAGAVGRQQPLGSVRASSDSKATVDDGATASNKIRLRTRPLTSMTYDTRRRSSPLLSIRCSESDGSAAPKPDGAPSGPAGGGGSGSGSGSGSGGSGGCAGTPAAAAPSTHRTHSRKLSSRKSDTALTTAARSLRAAGYREDSADGTQRSPEFTILHPDLKRRTTNSRRGRLASALMRLLR
ncbi:hypothetical protein H4R18_000830 [Coemansia javaensis]|uniref:Uncharacterized protein n=1 Tax=Coemansia javaensis TaxID=2761396 RepID=A0A9W8HME1_9FUNG|nr:hypothetical protein H4R18_000830 [Coemansia javaensis]